MADRISRFLNLYLYSHLNTFITCGPPELKWPISGSRTQPKTFPSSGWSRAWLKSMLIADPISYVWSLLLDSLFVNGTKDPKHRCYALCHGYPPSVHEWNTQNIGHRASASPGLLTFQIPVFTHLIYTPYLLKSRKLLENVAITHPSISVKQLTFELFSSQIRLVCYQS